MTAILAHRLELSGPRDMALDADLLHWLAEDVGMGQTEIWLRHTRGLVGELSGAMRMLDDLFPRARLALGKDEQDGVTVFTVALVPRGAATVFPGRACDAANALLAAVLRAYAQIGLRQAANDQEIAA